MYYDYRFKFLISDLALALGSFVWLSAHGFLNEGEAPTNMIGWQPGREATEDSPQAGDPDYYYVAIRSQRAPEELTGLTFSDYGLIPLTTPEMIAESEAVLGVWA